MRDEMNERMIQAAQEILRIVDADLLKHFAKGYPRRTKEVREKIAKIIQDAFKDS
jgi:hypothetical protein